MDLRKATAEDIEGIQNVAAASLTASYGRALDQEVTDAAVERWYDADQVAADLAAEESAFIVGVDDGDIVGFVQAYVVEHRDVVGVIDWLHVDPDRRGQGIGERLLERIEQELLDRGVERIEGRVLEENEAGGEFYAEHGFEQVGRRSVDIADRSFVERLYSKFPDETTGGQVLIESRRGPDGDPLFVAYDESERASKGPFYPAYEDREYEERYGYFCSNCESFDVAVDSMDRVECNRCGNQAKPTRWDAAYL